MPDLPPQPSEETTANGAATADALRERAETAERQRDEFLSLWRQAQADYENAHQRNRKDRELDQKFRGEKLALDLLPALDNLERAMTAARDAGEQGPLAQGVSLIHGQLMEALRKHGVTPIEALDQLFDPNVHQAVMQVPSNDRPPGTVVQVLEPGYRIHDRVLRAAKVIIAKS
jgi:molecular chaperone GrpE